MTKTVKLTSYRRGIIKMINIDSCHKKILPHLLGLHNALNNSNFSEGINPVFWAWKRKSCDIQLRCEMLL